MLDNAYHNSAQTSVAAMLEPAFYLNDLRFLRRFPELALKALSIVDREILRYPENLRYHLLKIQLCVMLGRKDDLYAAVLDLYFVLGKRGLPLKKRLLHWVCNYLSVSQCKMLRAGLKRGFRQFHVLFNPIPHCLICGVSTVSSGTAIPVERKESSSPAVT